METAVLSKDLKMLVSVYEKVFSSAEKGFINVMQKNILPEIVVRTFSKGCV